MRTLKELRHIDIKLSSTDVYFARVKDLANKKLDMDVWLPTKNKNLQRGAVWTLEQKQQLILSILYERYIPYICVMSLVDKAGSKLTDDILQIIDGKQRLIAMMEFHDNKFKIELEGGMYYFKQLPNDYRNSIAWHDIKCQIAYEELDQPFTDQQKIDWFMRINYLGTPQDAQHLKSLL